MQTVLGQEDSLPESLLGILMHTFFHIWLERLFSEKTGATFSVLVYNRATNEPQRG